MHTHAIPGLMLLKSPFRHRQYRWANELAERAERIVPEGVKVRRGGWSPGCEPLLQFRNLEWVDITITFPEGVQWSRQYSYPDQPTDTTIRHDAEQLLAHITAPE